MAKYISFRSGLLSVLFWSVISAAFIGPGTVTTAANAGSAYGYSLLWTILFSTAACILLQEAAARLTITSGMNLGDAIANRYGGKESLGIIPVVAGGAVIFGCAAYQAGNILGAVSGASLLLGWNARLFTVVIVMVCGLLLWFGNTKRISHLLGLLVAIMGIAFISVALSADIDWGSVFKNTLSPSAPKGSGWLVLGLIGTTIVPYNLFLGSGISKGQSVGEMRTGISIAVLIGGLITAAILLTGSRVEGTFSFEALKTEMEYSLGSWAGILFGAGLFAAGFTSSITAPLAAAVTAQSLFGRKGSNWESKSMNYKLIWGSILLTGFIFGVTNIKPIPAIILAQALNGILLPLVTIFLILVINDPGVMPRKNLNGSLHNFLMLAVVGITLLLGLRNLSSAIFSLAGYEVSPSILPLVVLISALITIGVGFRIFYLRSAVSGENKAK
jgi:Mn2+/Fe2+ NRAMP family transporter